MRVRRCVAIGVAASVLAAGGCLAGLCLLSKRFLGTGPATHDEALAWNDRYAILDAKTSAGRSYVLVHVWTTVPDLMQRVDLYCYEGVRKTAERVDFRFSRQIVSENLDDKWRRLEGGGYAARYATKGAIDLQKKAITVEFDQGPAQVIPVSGLEERGRCPAVR